MCGRFACMLDPDVICQACTYKDDKTGKFVKPRWREHPQPGGGDGGGGEGPSNVSYKYYPSANISPTKFTPIMVRGNSPALKGGEGEEEDGVVIMPMMFGLVPVYHKGEPTKHGLSTNNARMEGILESKLYKPVLNKRQLCVVVMQGFYEWKSVGAQPKQKKQPYLIFAPQKENVKIADDAAWNKAEWDEENGWNGPSILKMAGIFDVWKSEKGDKVYSFTIITMGSNKTLNWLHDRMPAILDSEEQVQGWLNATTATDTKELMSILKPVNSLQYGTWWIQKLATRDATMLIVCNQCREAKPNPLAKWLQTSKPKSEKRQGDEDDQKPGEKKPKLL